VGPTDATDLVEKSSHTCKEFDYNHPAYLTRNTDGVIVIHMVLLVQLQITEKRTYWATLKVERKEGIWHKSISFNKYEPFV
jgi:hypothetical protein